jgi:hypothetical protein
MDLMAALTMIAIAVVVKTKTLLRFVQVGRLFIIF